MKMTRLKKSLSFILCIVLIAAIALFAVGCNDNKTEEEVTTRVISGKETVLGEGKTSFEFTVVDVNAVETKFTIRTDKKIVGEALQELGLIQGDEGDYGLYVKTVNGITLDYDKDKKYWAFYVNDTYGATGVDQTEIKAGEVYSFRAE